MPLLKTIPVASCPNSSGFFRILDKFIKIRSQNKIKIVKALWSIIYSNEDADMYETNLMRRLAGLLYIDSKTMGDIKHKIKIESKEWLIS